MGELKKEEQAKVVLVQITEFPSYPNSCILTPKFQVCFFFNFKRKGHMTFIYHETKGDKTLTHTSLGTGRHMTPGNITTVQLCFTALPWFQ